MSQWLFKRNEFNLGNHWLFKMGQFQVCLSCLSWYSFSYPCRTCSHSKIFIGLLNFIGFVAFNFIGTAPHFIENFTLWNMGAKSMLCILLLPGFFKVYLSFPNLREDIWCRNQCFITLLSWDCPFWESIWHICLYLLPAGLSLLSCSALSAFKCGSSLDFRMAPPGEGMGEGYGLAVDSAVSLLLFCSSEKNGQK